MESGGFDYHIVFHSVPFLAKGMVLTLVLTVLGIAGGLVFGTDPVGDPRHQVTDLFSTWGSQDNQRNYYG